MVRITRGEVEELAEAIEKDNAVAFVGSGISMQPGTPNGGKLPNWEEMLRTLANGCSGSQDEKIKAVNDAIDAGRFLNAATLIRDILGGDEEADDRFKKRIIRQIENRGTPTQAHKLLVEIGFWVIVTTNYDLLIENAQDLLVAKRRYELRRIPYSNSQSNQIAENIQHHKPFIFHLHGDISNPKDIVISWHDYNKLLAHNPSVKSLAVLLKSSTILWIGYSHSDPDLNLVTAELSSYGISGGYQLVTVDDYELDAICRARKITPIPIGSHNEVGPFLNGLKKLLEYRKNLGPEIRDVNAWTRKITDHFLTFVPELPRDRFKLTIRRKLEKNGLDDPEQDSIKLFNDWTEVSQGAPPSKIAIVARPGCGKTVLLSMFANWLRYDWLPEKLNKESGDQERKVEFVPVVLFLTPDSIPLRDLLLFSVRLECQSNLDNNNMSEGLRQEFESCEISLSQDTDVSIKETDSRWLITDNEEKYYVRKADDKLNIYRDFTANDLLKHIKDLIELIDSQSGFPEKLSDTLEEPRRKHLVYLLFDGLDEFGSGKRGNLETLMEALRKLAEDKDKQINVFLT